MNTWWNATPWVIGAVIVAALLGGLIVKSRRQTQVRPGPDDPMPVRRVRIERVQGKLSDWATWHGHETGHDRSVGTVVDNNGRAVGTVRCTVCPASFETILSGDDLGHWAKIDQGMAGLALGLAEVQWQVTHQKATGHDANETLRVPPWSEVGRIRCTVCGQEGLVGKPLPSGA